MNEPATQPSRLLKITAVTARWLLGLLIAAWILFGLSVAVLHGWIVPRIGEYRSLLETQASRVIGVPVRIASIDARSDGIFPTFELRGVVLQDDRQREALRLERIVASVSPRSIWRLSFEQLYVERPQLDVRMDALGKLHVAGLAMSTETSGESSAADWFFAQRELVIEHGTVRWTDERRKAEPLLLSDVRFVARNGTRRHTMRLDATPPAGWGERFTVRGRFRQPLLSVRSGNWATWNGEIYTELPRIDVRRLGDYVSVDARIRAAGGGLRAWADVRKGRVVGGAVDLALDRVDASLGAELDPLVLSAVTGRLAGKRDDAANGPETLEFSTTDLQFTAADGLRWPGGNLWFRHTPADVRRTGNAARPVAPERGELKADRLDLAALALIAGRLPLGDKAHAALSAYAPRGVVENIDAGWQGPADTPQSYRARGKVTGLSVASQPASAAAVAAAAAVVAGTPVPASLLAVLPADSVRHRMAIGMPGLRGAFVDFEATQAGGSAKLAIAQGALDFPGIFEEPTVPIDRLSAQLTWKLDGDKVQVQVSKLGFANADASGELQATWRTSDPATSRGKSRFPGVLDLSGQLSRANGMRVHRYLPLDIPLHTRDYVRESVTRGTASVVDFKVRGDLHDMPFMDPRDGDFRIAAKVVDAGYSPATPSMIASGKTLPWPGLTGVSGELVFERAGMQVRNARGRIAGAPGIEVARADVKIADLSHHAPVLEVDAQARGPVSELLAAGAPLLGEAADAVRKVRATGDADYALRLSVPLETPEKALVKAGVTLAGNQVQLAPEAPTLSQVRGMLNFTETGFSLAGVQGRMIGGEMRVEGHGKYGTAGHDLNFSAQGNITADGMRAAQEIVWLQPLALRATGDTTYAAALSMRDGEPEFAVTSSLQGLGLTLPAPLAKPADTALPLRIERKLVLRESRAAGTVPGMQDELILSLGDVASANYVRDVSTASTRVLRGAIGVGVPAGESPSLPDSGVQANLQLGQFDIAAWQALFGEATGTAKTGTGSASDYLPTQIAVRAKALGIGGGRTLHDVVMGGSREGALWRANIDASELSGYAEYSTSQAGRIYARLARLRIAPSEAGSVESLLDEQPGALPALDIVIDEFELLGKHLGRAEIVAINRGGARREWRLDKLAFTMPEASFTAQGSWAVGLNGNGNGARDPRSTAMSFKLDMADAGALLARFGMKDVIRHGRGRLEGDVDWRGSPLSLDYPTLGGQLHVDVGSGQFLKADPGLAKLLGVLSLQALPRRLTLDFRDLFSEGFAFDFVRGDVKIVDGRASTNNLQMKGVNAAVLMDGVADVAKETQNLRVVVVPQINAGTAALVATAINPAIGLGTFLAQWLLSKPLSAAGTQEFQIDGTWTDPNITKVPRTTGKDASS
ncbi:YhdP family protein [Variovorax sp. RHLX14]|uniref:YhdP family protein n=1 Tax=Variovorax sp. RHLX14 TaxID=1259731 RepID=UPI003F47EFD0